MSIYIFKIPIFNKVIDKTGNTKGAKNPASLFFTSKLKCL